MKQKVVLKARIKSRDLCMQNYGIQITDGSQLICLRPKDHAGPHKDELRPSDHVEKKLGTADT